ncbi:Phage tail repeat like protein [Pseudovibrio axinellae]|uniref:Phage tail repeat like protein n=1 Tax=Pseudovibrio axinellae TaxID=989403 RepID=A0A165XH40_9HYPH|nr:hypothetical protein [Pseudovibrio axinellae]KZL17696.1 Phage tail repeat like protein [Pseudovibrio axinellae]SER43255.1 Phage tail repeat like [Pseudovibrio axinellae]
MATTPNLGLPLLDSSAQVSLDHGKVNQLISHLDTVLAQVLIDITGKSSEGHGHEVSGINGLIESLSGLAPVTHDHALDDLSDVSVQGAAVGAVLMRINNGWGLGQNLVTTTALTAVLAGKADNSHTHDLSTITGLSDALAGKAKLDAVNAFSGTQSAPSFQSTSENDLNLPPKNYPFGLSHQQVSASGGGPVNHGTCLTVRESDIRCLQVFVGKETGALYTRASIDAETWGSNWVMYVNEGNLAEMAEAAGLASLDQENTFSDFQSFEKPLFIPNNAIITSCSGGIDTYETSENVDHFWHDDVTNTWHCVSDKEYKAKGNSIIQIGKVLVGDHEGVHEGNLAAMAEAAGIGQVDGWLQGMEWKDVTASRSPNTVYQNTSDGLIFISYNATYVAMSVSSDNSQHLSIYAGSAPIPIPPGSYYQVLGNFTKWMECSS